MRSWIESNPESSSQSAPDSPIMGVIKDSGDATSQETSASVEAKEDASRVDKSTPSEKPSSFVAIGDAATVAAAGEAGGLGSSGTRLVPFQSLPSSIQEELGKDLFDDPLLTPENMKKLADYMKWSFRFTQVSLLLSSASQYRVV